MSADSNKYDVKIAVLFVFFNFLKVVPFRPLVHIQQHKEIDIMLCITNSTLMDKIYLKALAYIKIDGIIWVKQMLWAIKYLAKMIWKTSSKVLLHFSSIQKLFAFPSISKYVVFITKLLPLVERFESRKQEQDESSYMEQQPPFGDHK